MSLVDDQSLYSGLTSRTTRSNTSTRNCDSGSTDIKATIKNSPPSIKVEGPEICEPGLLASPNSIFGEKYPSFNRNSWDNVTFFGDYTAADTGVLSRSFNGHLETFTPQPSSTETSQRTLRSWRSLEKLARKESCKEKTYACSEASSFRSKRSVSQSPGLLSPKLHDDGDSFSETPEASTGQLKYQLTPLTPLSAYGTQYFPLEGDSGSPIRERQQRPAPSPVQPSKEEAEIQCRGRTRFQPKVQYETSLRDTSAQSWVSIDRSRSESASEGRKGDACVKLKWKTETEEGTASRYEMPNDAISFSSLSTLVKGVDVLEDIFGYDVLSRLKADSKHCVDDLKSKKARCSRSLKYGNDKIAYIHMNELKSLLSPSDVSRELEALVPLIFCGRSHLIRAKTRVATWRLDNQGADLVRAACHDLPRDDIGELKDINGSCSLVDKPRVGKEQDIIPPPIKKDVIKSFSIDFNFSYSTSTVKSLRPSGYKTTIRQLVPWQPCSVKNVDVKTALLASIIHPLHVQGDIPGYLYVYSTIGDFGARKIGVTAKDDIQVRMNRWRDQCKRRINLIYPLGDEKVSIPHVHRLEKLVHAELKEYRVVENNCGCGVKRHMEWFNAKDDHIKKVVQRWTEWLQKAPYEKIASQWVLKKEFQELDEICTPYEPLEAELALKGKIESQTRVAVTKSLQQRRSRRIAELHPRRSSRIAAAAK
ncbi:hypothetical protein MMC34_008248 [Xylographa carneopallida]|nr:hypothetical protein [Xylographa carneopallida]